MEVADRIQTSEDKAETFSAGDYLNTLDRFGPDSAEPSNNIIASPFDAEPNAFDAMIDEAAEEAAKVLDGVVEEVGQELLLRGNGEGTEAVVRRECAQLGPKGQLALAKLAGGWAPGVSAKLAMQMVPQESE